MALSNYAVKRNMHNAVVDQMVIDAALRHSVPPPERSNTVMMPWFYLQHYYKNNAIVHQLLRQLHGSWKEYNGDPFTEETVIADGWLKSDAFLVPWRTTIRICREMDALEDQPHAN